MAITKNDLQSDCQFRGILSLCWLQSSSVDKGSRAGTSNERSMALGGNIRRNVLHILVLAVAITLVLTSPATPPTEAEPGVIPETTQPSPDDAWCGEQTL